MLATRECALGTDDLRRCLTGYVAAEVSGRETSEAYG
jgi:hypothetical protein